MKGLFYGIGSMLWALVLQANNDLVPRGQWAIVRNNSGRNLIFMTLYPEKKEKRKEVPSGQAYRENLSSGCIIVTESSDNGTCTLWRLLSDGTRESCSVLGIDAKGAYEVRSSH